MKNNKKEKKDNIFSFPSKVTDAEREIEAILFSAIEPLDIDTIESRVSKKISVLKILQKIQLEYLVKNPH